MAFLGLKVPHETARLLGELEVPGKRESTAAYHITVLYLGKDVPIEMLAKAMVAAYGITSRTKPFTVRTSLLTCFPKGDDGVPIICRVESDPLHELQAELKTAYQAAEVPFSDKHPEYKPHVTLAYGEEPITDRRIPVVEWGAHELVLWGGDEGDRRLVVTFPFTIEGNQVIARRVAHRFMSGGPPSGGLHMGGP